MESLPDYYDSMAVLRVMAQPKMKEIVKTLLEKIESTSPRQMEDETISLVQATQFWEELRSRTPPTYPDFYKRGENNQNLFQILMECVSLVLKRG